MKIKQYDTVLLKDGREASIVEVFSDTVFLADVGSGPKDWETIDVTLDMIEKVVLNESGTPEKLLLDCEENESERIDAP